MTKAPHNHKKSAREERLFQNLLKITYEFIKGRRYSPLTRTNLIERLNVHPDHVNVFDNVLKLLHDEGKVTINQEKFIPATEQKKQALETGKKTPDDIVIGSLRLHPRGFGFVVGEGEEQDVFIPKPYVNGAVDGDTVEVLVNRESVSEKGPEGKILAIKTRKRNSLVGIIASVLDKHALAYSSLLGDRTMAVVNYKSQVTPLKVGDRVLLEVTDWGDQKNQPKTILKDILGHISDASIDTKVAILEYELRERFPEAAMQEAISFGTKVAPKDMEDREDLRELEAITIDPDTAKDFDDAISLTKEKTHYTLAVHIADVSHYVKPGSALDQEARLRCNSTYFPGICIPMLPHELSDNLCSLKEGVARLTVTVFVDIDFTGKILSSRMARTVIKSAKRFTYKQAKQVLDGELKSIHKPTLDEMVVLCGLLKAKRAARGSVELSMPDLVVLVDKDGKPTGTDLVHYDITHQMVEEFMLLANETVATYLANQGKELTYRIHEEPAEENLRDFGVLAATFGHILSPIPTPEEIQKFFVSIQGSPMLQYLSTSYIRSMRLASYSSDNIGHYGLSLQHYCHFTSPIRRYVDIVAHRLLFEPPYDKKIIQAICEDASERERLSAKAEMSVKQLKKLRLLDSLLVDDRARQFDAIVTKVKPFGIYFDLIELLFEGFLHVSELDNDYFVFDEKRMQLVGRSHGLVYHAGDPLCVRVKEIDYITREAKFELVAHDTQPENKKKAAPQGREKRRSKTRGAPFKKGPARDTSRREAPKAAPQRTAPQKATLSAAKQQPAKAKEEGAKNEGFSLYEKGKKFLKGIFSSFIQVKGPKSKKTNDEKNKKE